MSTGFKFPLFLLICFFIVSSCKKDISRTELLTSGKWKIIAIQASFLGMTNDAYAELEDCEKDNFISFKTDKTVEIDEGATKCNPDDPQIRIEGHWNMFENDTKIQLDSIDYNILELTDRKFKINGSVIELGFLISIELTFGK